ncbi:MAG: crossover junction endodeoxyribonuclease RuvC [Alphaproteobacteria bacterium]|jgi:crossover junction endodeoxyribonuclease RuvC|nr:crossover junction endodeoxyribonuclease RuvC [Alphaproteobacteria bacterium]
MTTRVLGIDPGLLHTGWAVVDTAGSSRKYIASGVILPNPKWEMSQRLVYIYRELTKICETFEPNECSIEIIFVNKNPKTTLILGQARASAIIAVANQEIPVFEYEPNVIKKALTGAGHADKTAVDKMVKILLPNANPKTADEADAIAIALSHTNMLRIFK